MGESRCLHCFVEGQPKKKWTCPCGEGYWDAVKQKFIKGSHVRTGTAGSREDYEAHLQKCSTCQKQAKEDDLHLPTVEPPWSGGDYGPGARPWDDSSSDSEPQQKAPKQLTMFVPAKNIDADILEKYIAKNVDSRGHVSMGTLKDGRSGFFVTAKRKLTGDMISEIGRRTMEAREQSSLPDNRYDIQLPDRSMARERSARDVQGSRPLIAAPASHGKELHPESRKPSSDRTGFGDVRDSPLAKQISRHAPALEDARTNREPQDTRSSRTPQDVANTGRGRHTQETHDTQETRYTQDIRDARNARVARDPRDPQDAQAERHARDARGTRDIRDASDVQDGHDSRDPRDPRDGRKPQDSQDSRHSRDSNKLLNPHEARNSKLERVPAQNVLPDRAYELSQPSRSPSYHQESEPVASTPRSTVRPPAPPLPDRADIERQIFLRLTNAGEQVTRSRLDQAVDAMMQRLQQHRQSGG